MCGIVGIVSEGAACYQTSVESMLEKMHHRGPDGRGIFTFENCVLGHVRLSIVDLATGAQPMLTEDKQLGISFNGEIYGYQELRREMSDYNFSTSSDTEVILAFFRRYGFDTAAHLPGMFAFALWDEREQSLYLARDRFGEKPLFYARGRDGEFIFASEIKAILASNLLKPELDMASVGHFLKTKYVHPNRTIYKNIFTLPAAHQLVFKNGTVKISRYWDLPQEELKINQNEAIEEFQRLLKQAVARQMVADVPVGAFLSGGLDSSTIVAEASDICSDLNTFSFGFRHNGESGRFDETPYARAVAEMYGTRHYELSDDREDFADLLWKMQDIYDEPFGDTSNIPTYLIAEKAARFTKVVLTGDGADELLGGYSAYRRLDNMKAKFGRAGRMMAKTCYQLKKLAGMNCVSLHNKLKEDKEAGRLVKKYGSIAEFHYQGNCHFSNEELYAMGIPQNEDIDSERRLFSTWTADDAMRDDLCRYMPGDILVKIDRASMANSLELRSPFLDVNLAEFCIALPLSFKITENTDKVLLRQAYQKKWPVCLRQRKKQGFSSPYEEWLKTSQFQDLKQDLLLNRKSRLYDILNFEKVKPYIQHNDPRLWNLLVLAMWLIKRNNQ